VLLFPTLSDGFGLVQVEAMAHGLPVIATPCCGEVVQDTRNGFIVPPRDSDAISDRLLTLLEQPDLLARMSAAAYSRSRDFHPDRIWTLYKSVLTPNSSD
jgi:glycosyltransferase involved in cell wall biosynthesis